MKYVFLFLCWIVLQPVFSQEVAPNNTKKEVEHDSTKQHSVKLAAILSAALPGAGQVYNHIAMPKGKKKAYWKVPLIYAGLGVTGYFAVKNHLEQKVLKQEYINRTEYGLPPIEKYSIYDDAGILQLYNQKITRRDLLFLGMGLVYLLQIADAAVEAHFVNFDVSKDLSMKIRPAVMPMNYSAAPTVGISLQLSLK
jgi:Na+-transporting methylmalonyl-CoA/oxaloacetate decarboxylase gamma subunit